MVKVRGTLAELYSVHKNDLEVCVFGCCLDQGSCYCFFLVAVAIITLILPNRFSNLIELCCKAST